MFSKIENSEELNRPKENYTKTYRDKDREKYNKSQRDLYHRLKENAEWKRNFNEKAIIYNKKYREKKKAEILESGIVVRPRGRPRKFIVETLAI